MKGANKWLAQLALVLFFAASAGDAYALRIPKRPPTSKPDGIPRTPPGKPSLPPNGQQPSQSCEEHDMACRIRRELCSSPDSGKTLTFCDDTQVTFPLDDDENVTPKIPQSPYMRELPESTKPKIFLPARE